MGNTISDRESNSLPTVLIFGTGIAGLFAALKLAENAYVILVTKDEISEGATRYAQGGIASVWSGDDSFEFHVEDTLKAGAGLCRTEVVDFCVKEGPARVRELIEYGVTFTQESAESAEATVRTDDAKYDLHREGGHQKRRILHADDLTGWEIEKTLVEKVKAHPRISIKEHHLGIDLITEGQSEGGSARAHKGGRCIGAYVLDIRSGKILSFAADGILLCTGGAGRAYLYTSNPDVATGDGIAMAYRAGARVANLEFMQFHPTCLYHPTAKTFLISEALRGEGAELKTLSGRAFMSEYHELGSLAPRDVVARAIDMEMKKTGERHVVLDAREIGEENLKKKFPNIFETCKDLGLDITREPIPVVPAAHYTCGGVLVDEKGRTTLPGLFAIGEVSCTGLHGANRLASNSLLEAVVYAHRAVEELKTELSEKRERKELPPQLSNWEAGTAVKPSEKIDIAANWDELRTLMWNYVGIVRSNRRLLRARRRLDTIRSEVSRMYWEYLLTKDLVELRNLVLVCDLIVQSALSRKESRGLHYTTEYPDADDTLFLHDTVL